MTENKASDPQTNTRASAEAVPAYASAATPRRVKRVKLALFLASLAACVMVAIIGFLIMTLSTLLIGLSGGRGGLAMGTDDFGSGALLAAQLSALNFILFFITIPAAAIAMGLSIARLPHRGIAALKAYLRWGAIWGAILVGGTTCFFGFFGGPLSAAGALVCGGFIGALAGAFCGFLFHAIVQPARQLTELDVSVF